DDRPVIRNVEVPRLDGVRPGLSERLSPIRLRKEGGDHFGLVSRPRDRSRSSGGWHRSRLRWGKESRAVDNGLCTRPRPAASARAACRSGSGSVRAVRRRTEGDARSGRDPAGTFVTMAAPRTPSGEEQGRMDVREAAPAVVTGGSRGIGRAIVERLAAGGAPVVFGYATERGRAEEVVEAVRAAGGSAWAVRADLAEPDGVDRLFAGADEHLGGRLGVLVNNAAVTGRTAFADASTEEFDRVLAVNARAALLAMQHAERRMAGGGRIVNISSVSTAWPAADEALYAASKGALEQLSRVASRALGP